MTHQSTRIIALIGFVIMAIFYVLTTFEVLGDNPVGQTGSFNQPLIVPAGYAFAIWGPIYLGLLVFPIYQLIVKKDSPEEWKAVRIWYAINVVANGLWLVAASYNWLIITNIIIVPMLYSLVRINDLLITIKAGGNAVNFWTERLVFLIYFAWITLATALNISATLEFYQWDGFGLSDVAWTVIISVVAAFIAGWIFRQLREAAYAAVVIWAFIALFVKHIEINPVIAYVSAGIVLAFIVLIFTTRRPAI